MLPIAYCAHSQAYVYIAKPTSLSSIQVAFLASFPTVRVAKRQIYAISAAYLMNPAQMAVFVSSASITTIFLALLTTIVRYVRLTSQQPMAYDSTVAQKTVNSVLKIPSNAAAVFRDTS